MSKWGRKQRPPPEGYEVVEPTLTAIDNELRDKVNESPEGKREKPVTVASTSTELAAHAIYLRHALQVQPHIKRCRGSLLG